MVEPSWEMSQCRGMRFAPKLLVSFWNPPPVARMTSFLDHRIGIEVGWGSVSGRRLQSSPAGPDRWWRQRRVPSPSVGRACEPPFLWLKDAGRCPNLTVLCPNLKVAAIGCRLQILTRGVINTSAHPSKKTSVEPEKFRPSSTLVYSAMSRADTVFSLYTVGL